MKKNYKIKGLDCAICAASLERAIQKIDGVNEASISFFTEKMVIDINEEEQEKIMKNLKKVIRREEPDVSIEEI